MVSDSLLRRILRFRKAIERLRRLKAMNKQDLIVDEDKLDVLENNMRIAIEALLDVGRYIISKKGWEPPTSYREVARVLHKHLVIDQGERTLLEGLIGLRNVIVHMYAEIDYEKLIKALDLLDDIEKVMQSLLSYISSHGIDP